jgi:hypothetical protein
MSPDAATLSAYLVRMKWPCVCCGFFTLSEPTGSPSDEICQVCFWQNDPADNEGGEVRGPNKVSLAEARRNFASFGASEERLREFVRDPEPDELPPGR